MVRVAALLFLTFFDDMLCKLKRNFGFNSNINQDFTNEMNSLLASYCPNMTLTVSKYLDYFC